MAFKDKENVPVYLVVSSNQGSLEQSMTMSLSARVGRLTPLLILLSQQVAFLIKHDFMYKVIVRSVLDYALSVYCHSTMHIKDKYSIL